MFSIDARVPVRFGAMEGAGEGDAVLAEGAGVPGGWPGASFEAGGVHPAGCACCVGRSAAAGALALLFQRRARGEVAFFRSVLVVGGEAGVAEVRAALAGDPLVAAWFRVA